MTLLCTSATFAGLDSLLRSRNSDIGLRFAKRVATDCDLTLLKRSPKLTRDVRASRGMLIPAILDCGQGKDFESINGERMARFWRAKKAVSLGKGGASVKGWSARISAQMIPLPAYCEVKDVEATIVFVEYAFKGWLQEILLPKREYENTTKEAK